MDPINGNIYLLVPANQCENCINLNGSKLSKEFNEHFYILSAISQKHFKNFANYYYDSKNNIAHLKLVDFENKFILYNNNKVEYIVKANINTLQKTEECPKPVKTEN